MSGPRFAAVLGAAICIGAPAGALAADWLTGLLLGGDPENHAELAIAIALLVIATIAGGLGGAAAVLHLPPNSDDDR